MLFRQLLIFSNKAFILTSIRSTERMNPHPRQRNQWHYTPSPSMKH